MAGYGKILSGRYDGATLFERNGRVYIERPIIELSSNTVASASIEGSTDAKTSKQYRQLFGTEGAVYTSGMKDHMIVITWKNGEKSFASCSDNIASLVLASPYKSAQSADIIRKAYEEKKRSDKTDNIVLYVVGGLWLLFYFFSSL